MFSLAAIIYWGLPRNDDNDNEDEVKRSQLKGQKYKSTRRASRVSEQP